MSRTIEGRHFGQEFTPGDGIDFVDRTFDGTVVTYGGGECPVFLRCTGPVHIRLVGCAARTADGLAGLYQQNLAHMVDPLLDAIRRGGTGGG